MRIIHYPWIAINIDSDCVRVAYPTSKNGGDSFDITVVEPPEHAFDMVFHYSGFDRQWRFGAEAWEWFEKDPAGFVAVHSNPLHWEQRIDFGDGTSVSYSELIVRLLQRIREHCETVLFNGEAIRACVISVQHRYNTIRSVYRQIAEEAGFAQVLFRDAMVAGALFWKSEWQLERNYVLTCNISDARITTSLLKKSFQGFVKTGIRSHNTHFGANRIDAHVLSLLCGERSCPEEDQAGKRMLIRKFRMESMLKPVQKKYIIDIGGENRSIESSHRIEAMKRFVADLYEELAPFLENVSEKISIPLKEIPLIVLGMGRYDADLETTFQARFGRDVEWSYFWPHSEYAIGMGIALMLRPPVKLPGDLDEAARIRERWYADARQPENYRAQYKLGRRLEDGRGICQVEEEAVDWFRLSAKQGYPRALFRLSYMIARDKGTDYDPAELETLIGDLETRGFRMDDFRRGVAYFQEGREIEIENQKVMDPNRLREFRQLKKDAEEDFQRCRIENGFFASARQRFIPSAVPVAPPVLPGPVPVPRVIEPTEVPDVSKPDVPKRSSLVSFFARLLNFSRKKE